MHPIKQTDFELFSLHSLYLNSALRHFPLCGVHEYVVSNIYRLMSVKCKIPALLHLSGQPTFCNCNIPNSITLFSSPSIPHLIPSPLTHFEQSSLNHHSLKSTLSNIDLHPFNLFLIQLSRGYIRTQFALSTSVQRSPSWRRVRGASAPIGQSTLPKRRVDDPFAEG